MACILCDGKGYRGIDAYGVKVPCDCTARPAGVPVTLYGGPYDGAAVEVPVGMPAVKAAWKDMTVIVTYRRGADGRYTYDPSADTPFLENHHDPA